MPQDAFTLRLAADELDGALKGGRISKIIQPQREEIVFYIYLERRTFKLILNVNASDCGVYFSDEEAEAPLVAPNFCMLLRKHLQNAEILSVSTVGFERVVAFRLFCTSDFNACERVLYSEIMGKYSNLILTESGVIMGALKTAAADLCTKRLIFAGARYALPAPQQDKVDPSDKAALTVVLSRFDGTADFLFRNVAGLAPCTAERIVRNFRGGDVCEYIYDYLFSDMVSPRVTEKDFFARSDEGIPFPTIAEAQTFFYARRRAKKHFDAKQHTLTAAVSATLKKQEKRLKQIAEKRAECADAELLRVKGELITANLYRLQRGMRGAELENYYDGNKPLKIALDPSLTPSENAQAYFKKYRKQKRTLDAVAPQQAACETEIDYLESVAALLSTAAEESDLSSIEEELTAAGILSAPKEKQRKQKEIPFRTFEREGFRILAGRNNLQNERLVRSSAPDDIWLHAQKRHSSHIVIRTEKRKVPDSVLLYAAKICARYSDAKGERIPVDYCAVKYVKKPPKSKPGLVTYSAFQTIYTDGYTDGETL